MKTILSSDSNHLNPYIANFSAVAEYLFWITCCIPSDRRYKLSSVESGQAQLWNPQVGFNSRISTDTKLCEIRWEGGGTRFHQQSDFVSAECQAESHCMDTVFKSLA